MYKKLDGKRTLIAGIGSALIDMLVFETDDFLKEISDIKGGMTLVEGSFIESVAGKISGDMEVVPGGAACNTIIGVGRLGAEARFVGKRGKDEFGTLFEGDLTKNNVAPVLFTSDTPTGRVLSIITPDAQRSMFTHLGASAEMVPDEITEGCFEGAAIVLVEGYLLFNRDLMMKALEAARAAGAVIAMDLASFTVVEESLDFLNGSVMEYIDILIANEDEARAFTGHEDESEAIKALAEKADVAVLKVGKRGSYIASEGEIVTVAAQGGEAVIDTTGAGDLWAAGFLYGLINGLPMEKCGEIASACGYEVCRVTGAAIPDDGWARIQKLL